MITDNIIADIHARAHAAENTIDGLKAKLARTTALAKAAIKYINMTPCDPDVSDEQYDAWLSYKTALAQCPELDEAAK